MLEILKELPLWQKIALGLVLLAGVAMKFGPQSRTAPGQSSAKDPATDRIFTHGFTTGFSMARGGAVKPNSDQVDALARRAAAELGESGGMGFKMAWKSAFWTGWNRGD